jgi:hypothetical protein
MDTTWFATHTRGFMHDGANITKFNIKEVTFENINGFFGPKTRKNEWKYNEKFDVVG